MSLRQCLCVMSARRRYPARGGRGARGRSSEQLCLAFPNGWGGRRKGAGRKLVGVRRTVPHRSRPVHRAAEPVHVTMRVALRSLRAQFVYPTVVGVIRDTNRARGETFRIAEYSVQAEHVHLIVEAESTHCLISGMRSFSARLVGRVNRLLFRRGQLVSDRWHGRALSTPRAVRRALVYVLANFKKHGLGAASAIDPCSSAPFFTHFEEFPRVPPFLMDPTLIPRAIRSRAPPVARASSWLLRVGWTRYGLISIREAPLH